MNINKLLEQLSDESKNVPDNSRTIINKARAEGLIKDNAPEISEPIDNGSGTVSASKNKRIIAAVASLVAAGAIAATAIVLLTTGNSDNPGGHGPTGPLGPSITLCEEELGTDYAVGAISTANLLSCFDIGGSAQASVKLAKVTRDGLIEKPADMETQISNFGKYMGAFGAFYGADEDLVTVLDYDVKDEKYPNSIQIRGRYANGERADFAMYYLEALDLDYEGEDERYYLEGSIYIDGVGYYLEGSRTFASDSDGAEAYGLVIRAYPDANDKDDYVQMTIGESADADGKVTKSYDYKVFKDGVWAEQTVSYMPAFDSEKAFDLVLNYGDDEDSKFTVYRPQEGSPIVTVGYEADGRRSSFRVSQTRGELPCVIMQSFMYDLNSDNTCTLKGFKSGEQLTGGVLEIPEDVVVKNDIYKVTAIGSSAFSVRSEIKKLVIPSSVTSIGSNAFWACRNLEELELNEGLKRIDKWAFYDDEALKSISIPASVTYISGDAFNNCAGLQWISVAEGNAYYSGEGNCLITRSSYAQVFQGCENSVIPQNASISSIGSAAFAGTNIANVTLPDTLSYIYDEAFRGCKKLTEITIPNSIISIYEGAFQGCEKLTDITLPEKGIYMNRNVFNNTGYMNDDNNWSHENGYSSLYIGKHLISWRLDSNNVLPDVVIKTGTLSIASEAFGSQLYENGKCASVTLNREIEVIGNVPYIGGRGCKSIRFADGATTSNNGEYSAEGNCLIEEKNGRRIMAGCDESVIPNNVAWILSYAFMGCDFNQIVIPNSVERIEEGAFANSLIKEITIPSSVQYIERLAFSDCHNLNSITFEEGDGIGWYGLSLGMECFRNCNELTQVFLPSHLMSIDIAFMGCQNLQHIRFNSTAVQIHGLAENCPNLNVSFPGSAEEWYNCYNGTHGLNFWVHLKNGDILGPDYH